MDRQTGQILGSDLDFDSYARHLGARSIAIAVIDWKRVESRGLWAGIAL